MIDHSAILSRLAELRATAEAADNPHWLKMIANARLVGWPTASVHGGVWNPRAALRWISWAEDVARRHAPKACECGNPSHFICTKRPSEEWPCEDYARMAGALGLEETR